ncbi:PREDICTED: neurocalcin homolog [Branchiostoma belcheri]|uniref:Neurocalcin homolog n=1 Tax=Branchiostoma belcheri TaxID=7741 RepID=A0A6P4Y668_BRABE|nr:PREDICTED: neurocalcin homolog [Branchiostoma belcheri]
MGILWSRFKEKREMKKMLSKVGPTTHFARHEAEYWMKIFYQDVPDGKLSEDEFVEYFGNFYINANEGSKKTLARQIFKAFDRNDNGYVSLREYLLAMSTLLRGDTLEKLEWSFILFDLDGDGMVSREDMEGVLLLYNDLRTNKEAGNTDEELAAIVDREFRLIDRAGKGRLGKRQFIDGVSRSYRLLGIMPIR